MDKNVEKEIVETNREIYKLINYIDCYSLDEKKYSKEFDLLYNRLSVLEKLIHF